MHPRAVAALTSITLAALALSSCGDDDTAETSSTPPPAAAPATSPAPQTETEAETSASVTAAAVAACLKQGAAGSQAPRTLTGSDVGTVWPKSTGPTPEAVVLNGDGLVVAIYEDVDAAKAAFTPVVNHDDVKQYGATVSQRANAIVNHAPDEAKEQLDLADECVGTADQSKTVTAAGS